MKNYLVPLFIIVPLIELALLLQLGAFFGVGTTIAVVLCTGVVGGILARAEGLRVYQSFMQEISRGHMPTDHLFDGVMILVGGIFLVTPGVLTDFCGLLLLLPPVRRLVRSYVRKRISFGVKSKIHTSRYIEY